MMNFIEKNLEKLSAPNIIVLLICLGFVWYQADKRFDVVERDLLVVKTDVKNISTTLDRLTVQVDTLINIQSNVNRE